MMTMQIVLLRNMEISKKTREEILTSLRSARRELALFQHHDAVTGTAKAKVVKDYAQRLLLGFQQSAGVIQTLLGSISSLHKQQWRLASEWKSVSSEPEICTIPTSKESTVIVVYNTVVRQRDALIRLRVEDKRFTLHDSAGQKVDVQLNPVLTDDGKVNTLVFELVFLAHLEPLQLLEFTIKRGTSQPVNSVSKLELYNSNSSNQLLSNTRISNETEALLRNHRTYAVIASCNGMLQYTYEIRSGIKHTAKTSLVRYTTGSSFNPFRDKSGAYIFLPDGAATELETINPRMALVRGSITQDLHVFTEHVTITYSLVDSTDSSSDALFITTKTNLNSMKNAEVALRINTHLKNTAGDFYTDSNGFQTMRRERLWTLPLQGQFYPMTSWMWLDDGLSRATLMAAQPHGVSSLATGELEVVLDRRLMQDDWRGLNQGVTDNRPTTAKFSLLLERRSSKEKLINMVPRLSPKATLILDVLNSPALPVVAASPNLAAPVTQPIPTSVSWPCATRLVLSRPTEHLRSARLLLQSVATDCTFEQPIDRCTAVKAVNLQQLFGSNFRCCSARRFLSNSSKIDGSVKIATWELTDLELFMFDNAPL